jgi:hypothetical protein
VCQGEARRDPLIKPNAIVVTTSVVICDGSIRFGVKIESTRTGAQITLITQIEEFEKETGVESR